MKLERIQKVLNSTFIAFAAPDVLAGMLGEWAKILTVKEVVLHVKNETTLWSLIDPTFQKQIETLGPRIPNLDFMTEEWALGAVKDTNPTVASLFINWEDAMVWLRSQITDLKKHVRGEKIESQS